MGKSIKHKNTAESERNKDDMKTKGSWRRTTTKPPPAIPSTTASSSHPPASPKYSYTIGQSTSISSLQQEKQHPRKEEIEMDKNSAKFTRGDRSSMTTRDNNSSISTPIYTTIATKENKNGAV